MTEERNRIEPRAHAHLYDRQLERDAARPDGHQTEDGAAQPEEARRPGPTQIHAPLRRQQPQGHPLGEGAAVAEQSRPRTEGPARGLVAEGVVVGQGRQREVDGAVEEVAEAQVQEDERVALQGQHRSD